VQRAEESSRMSQSGPPQRRRPPARPLTDSARAALLSTHSEQARELAMYQEEADPGVQATDNASPMVSNNPQCATSTLAAQPESGPSGDLNSEHQPATDPAASSSHDLKAGIVQPDAAVGTAGSTENLPPAPPKTPGSDQLPSSPPLEQSDNVERNPESAVALNNATSTPPSGEPQPTAKPIIPPEKLEKMRRMRRHVATEIMMTEKSYVESLQVIVSIWIPAFEATYKDELLKDAIFTNFIAMILQLNSRFLGEVSAAVENWDDEKTRLGKPFIDFAPYFRMYTNYVSKHGLATSELEKLEKTSTFQKMQTKAMKNPAVKQLGLSSYLIMPIQRIPRYKLLLTELLKATPEDHIDYSDVSAALNLVEKVAAKVNESIRAQQAADAMRRLQAELRIADLVQPTRYFVKSGTLIKQCRNSDEEYELYLFNDMLIYATRGIRGLKPREPFHFDETFHLAPALPAAVRKVDGETPEETAARSFCVLSSKTKSIVFRAANIAERDEWFNSISNCIQIRAKQILERAYAGMSTRGLVVNPVAAAFGSPSLSAVSSSSPGSLLGIARAPSLCSLDTTGDQASTTVAPSVVVDDPEIALAVPSVITDYEQLNFKPLWETDSSSDECRICGRAFNMVLRRRHHCRQCGALVCADCSPDKINDERACIRCVEAHGAQRRSSNAGEPAISRLRTASRINLGQTLNLSSSVSLLNLAAGLKQNATPTAAPSASTPPTSDSKPQPRLPPVDELKTLASLSPAANVESPVTDSQQTPPLAQPDITEELFQPIKVLPERRASIKPPKRKSKLEPERSVPPSALSAAESRPADVSVQETQSGTTPIPGNDTPLVASSRQQKQPPEEEFDYAQFNADEIDSNSDDNEDEDEDEDSDFEFNTESNVDTDVNYLEGRSPRGARSNSQAPPPIFGSLSLPPSRVSRGTVWRPPTVDSSKSDLLRRRAASEVDQKTADRTPVPSSAFRPSQSHQDIPSLLSIFPIVLPAEQSVSLSESTTFGTAQQRAIVLSCLRKAMDANRIKVCLAKSTYLPSHPFELELSTNRLILVLHDFGNGTGLGVLSDLQVQNSAVSGLVRADSPIFKTVIDPQSDDELASAFATVPRVVYPAVGLLHQSRVREEPNLTFKLHAELRKLVETECADDLTSLKIANPSPGDTTSEFTDADLQWGSPLVVSATANSSPSDMPRCLFNECGDIVIPLIPSDPKTPPIFAFNLTQAYRIAFARFSEHSSQSSPIIGWVMYDQVETLTTGALAPTRVTQGAEGHLDNEYANLLHAWSDSDTSSDEETTTVPPPYCPQ